MAQTAPTYHSLAEDYSSDYSNSGEQAQTTADRHQCPDSPTLIQAQATARFEPLAPL